MFLIGAGCESKKEAAQKTEITRDEPAMPAQTTREPTRPPAAEKMSDPEIAMVAATAHANEIATAELALARSQDPDVQEFAKMMIADHGAAKARSENILGKAGLTPAESDPSKQLAARGQDSLTRLEALEGAEFDRAYIADQVAAHMEVLGTLDGTLVPGATHADLQALLTEARPMVAGHLAHARALQQKLDMKLQGR
jgi:putative membrane protein